MKVKNDLTSKPYFKCVDCTHRKDQRCNFTRTSEMTLYEWCEYIRAMKAINGLTNDDIVRESGVSVGTIERIMALNSDQDIMRETARRIEKAVCGTATHFPCYQTIEQLAMDSFHDAEQLKINHLLEEIKDLRRENERKDKIIDRLLER